MKKEEKIILRVDKYLKDSIKVYCKKNNTTISNLITSYLETIRYNSSEYIIYYNQWIKTNSITKDILNEINNKTYHSGRKIEIGDKVLCGYLKDNNSIKLISFNLDEIYDIYGLSENDISKNFPYLTLKNNE